MIKNLLQVVVIAVLSLFIFWIPFILKQNTLWGIDFGGHGMDVIVQNFDGLNFLVVAKSLYDPSIIATINTQFLTGNDPIYFSAHFPLFALVIKFFAVFVSLPNALLITIILSNVLLAISLYTLARLVSKDKRVALLVTVIALFFPARMLSVRAVGSNEPLFIFFVLTSLIYAIKNKTWLSAITGALAVLTRSPGILLFGLYAWQFLADKDTWRTKIGNYLPYILMPLTLLGLFVFYGIRYSDPLAYFHSGDNLHLFFPPFQIFSNTASWINDMWREDIIYLYVFYSIGVFLLDKKWELLKRWAFIYGTTLLFVVHRDLARYALPLAPIALVGYAPLLEKVPRKLWIVGAILLIPIYLMGWQFVLKNIQPISNWGALL
jgi:Gpi18-like mannosyltransferase